ncbi:hypothetical protein, conserved [Babesia ovata]|uniref:6-Cys domain-containing protein n=1 Tax=Babesia ovata TaxID=189622 RepID=A0A2H6KDN6_9APIC|nr:uncharacterized protein BOVATA_026050 [Babesia ovata]GBE61112.1 hypothetical protein, conserved [Babesia ovata]
MDIGLLGSATVICPRLVSDTEYVWHPQPSSDLHEHINTYVSDNGKLSSVDISDVVRTESDNPFIWFESNQSRTELHLEFSTDDIYAITENRLVFICGPTDLFVSDILQRHLDRLKGGTQMQSFPWTSPTALTREIAKMGTGLGVFFLYRGRLHLPLQGCGSRPSPLFATDEVTVDPVTGTRSCVADPMSESPIGFVCEGRLEPEDCMRSLIDESGEVVAAPESHPYWSFVDHRPWVIAKYFNDFALRPFHGECRCMDSETGQVKARIEIRSKAEYVCDITSMIFRNRVRPIHDHWCSVVLHPGSTLTIRLPKQTVNSASINEPSDDLYMGADEDVSSVSFSQMMSLYDFETEFRPVDLNKLWQLKNIYHDDFYSDIAHHEALAGDALELDVSQMSLGEVKLKYHQGKPLALRNGYNSFFYHWTLRSRNKNVFERIRALVKVSFAFTHHYKAVGCDTGSQILFDPQITERYCSSIRWGNGIGETYECTYNKTLAVLWAAIHCRPDEELLPKNCESTGFDLYSNSSIASPESVQHATANPIPRFQLLGFNNHNTLASYACVCVDQNGREKSRLILESNHYEQRRYVVSHGDTFNSSVSHILAPWHEIGLSSDAMTPPDSLMIYHVPHNPVILHVGTTLFMRCALAPGAQHDADNMIRPRWFPISYQNHHYAVTQTPDGPELVRVAHSDSIATTPGGLEVFTIYSTPRNYEIGIKSRRGAILISKDLSHKRCVPITFLCGKTPETSDLSIVTDGASTSESSTKPNLQTIVSSTLYTWHVVEVNVETTDPYMQGCGVTYSSDEMFKPETPKLYDADGQPQFGCKIDLQAANEAAFYCPAPYVLDPPNCFRQVLLDSLVKNTGDLSKSLVASRSNHFVILNFDSSLVGVGETLRQAPPLKCRCVTVKGVVLSTVQIENYYSK